MKTRIGIDRTIFATALACVAWATSTAVSAQTLVAPAVKAQAPALAKICEGDYRQHCPGVQPGGGRILACLHKNADRLSQACREGLAQAR